MFTMVYACIGIPLMLVTLQDFGKLLGFALGTVWKNFSNLVKKLKRRGRKSRNLSVSSQQPFQWSEGSQSDLPLSVAFVLTIFWILLCGGIFRHWERDWTYIEAVYFMYISLTTIGLGDIMPVHISGMFAGFGLILVGLTLVSLLFDMIQQRISHYKRKLTGERLRSISIRSSQLKSVFRSH